MLDDCFEHWQIQCFGGLATATLSRRCFSIFPQQKRKKEGLVLPRVGFENRLLTMIVASSDKPPFAH
jgi:hypothetical protein